MNISDNFKTVSRLSICVFLLLWTLPLLIGGYDRQSLMAHDEGLYATRARLMWDTGNWIAPWLEPHHKTPGIYWLLAIVYRFLGMSESTVRLPSAIFSLVAVILVYEIGTIIFSQYVGFLAAAILNLQFLWLQYSRLANPDFPTIVLVLSAIVCLLKSEDKLIKNRHFYIGFAGFCLGVALVFRGFMLGVPLLALIPYLILRNRYHNYLTNPWLYCGFIIGTFPLCIWLYLNWLQFGNETFTTLLGLVVDLGNDNRHDHSSFFYIVSLASSAFPWSLLSILGAIAIFRSKTQSYKSLVLGFSLIAFILISIYSTRLHHYSLILYPFTALGSAVVLYCLWQPKQKQFLIIGHLYPVLTYVFTGFGIIFIVAAIVVFLRFPAEITYAKIALITGLPWLFLSIAYHQKYSRSLWIFLLLIGNWLGLLTATNLGAIGNYYPDLKEFIQQPKVSQIINNNTVYLLRGGGEVRTLWKFYLPNFEINKKDAPPPACSYAISDAEYLASYAVPYKSLANFRDWQLIKTTNCSDPN